MKVADASVLDAYRIGRWQIVILVLAVLALVLDGLDSQLLAFVTPIILKEWQIDRVAFAPALAAALIGMSFGSGLGGLLGDRFGRRPVLIASTICFGIGTIAISLTNGIVTLTALRLGSGLAFGAATPNAFALAAEWIPHRARARAIGVMAVAVPLGGMIGAGASLFLLPHYGWRGTFVICGVVTIALAILMFLFLSESAGFLLATGQSAEASRVLRRVVGSDGGCVGLPQRGAAPGATARTGTIFTRDLARLNIGAPLGFFVCNFATFAIVSWMPTILNTGGFAMANAIRSALVFNLMAVIGTYVTASVIPRWGSKRMMAGSCLVTLVAAIGMALVLLSPAAAKDDAALETLFVLIGVSGYGLGGGMASCFAIVSTCYPVDRRATGIGVGVMVGRVGGIVTVFSGGLLLRAGNGDPTVFLGAIAIMMVLGLAAVFINDRHIAPRPRTRTRPVRKIA
jgi:AAHS family 4-hydroxybenzoate transporter-like MFS transporter